MFNISGLDKLQKEMQTAQQALSDLDGELGRVSFDPFDPVSIESAIQHAQKMVEDRIGQYASNPIVGPLISEMKEAYRNNIVQQAAEARSKEQKDM
ncbi:hypothetical protein [Herbaspirillum huttiense]|uniref:hypothetical protein n=1 Tax=Herbaspirillum huttiense TaxID=863372 RepID=UPI0031E21242